MRACDGLGFRSHFYSRISTTIRSRPGRPVHRSLQLAKDVFLALPVKMIQNTYYIDVLSAGRLQIKYAQFGSATCRNDPLKGAKVYHGGLVDAYRNLPSLHKIGTKLLIILLLKYPKTIFFSLCQISHDTSTAWAQTVVTKQSVPKQVLKYVLSNRVFGQGRPGAFIHPLPCPYFPKFVAIR